MHHRYCEYQMLLKMMDQWTDKGRPTPDFHWEVTGPESGGWGWVGGGSEQLALAGPSLRWRGLHRRAARGRRFHV